MGISKLNPSAGGIPYGNTAGRPTASLGKLYGNGETARIEIYTGNGWQNIVQETPGVASATGHYYESDNSGTFTISGTNFVSGAIAYAVGTNGTEYQATTTTYNSLVQLTALFENLSSAYEPYDIKITNPSNLFGLLPDAFYINDSPLWGTTSGSLGTLANGSVSIQLSSTDDESQSITYVLSSGALPNGLSLSSSGLISGTMSANIGTYSFTITASDGTNSPVARSFSISVPTPIITGGTLSSDATYYYRTFTSSGTLSVLDNKINADILMVAGGGGSSTHSSSDGGGGGAGAGGLLYTTSAALTIQSYSITVGAGGGNRSNGADTTITANSFDQLTAVGGGAGGSYSNMNANSGGSGGGQAGAMTTSHASGTSGQGYEGGHGGQGNPQYGGGGGGGAGGPGGSTNTDTPGSAGVGSSQYSSWGLATSTGHNVSGTVYYAGGGGGGTRSASYASGYAGAVGGLGGGGTGSGNQNSNTPTSGTANTGGGAGGTSTNPNIHANGGSGIVIVRYTRSQVGG